MKILHVIPSLGRGGAERQLVNLVGATTHTAHSVHVLHGPYDFASDIEATGTPVTRHDLGHRPWISGPTVLARALGTERPDIVQTWLFDANLSAAIARAVRPSVPLVTTLHNLDYDEETIAAAGLPRRKVRVLQQIDRALARLPNATYVACSTSVAESALRHIAVRPARMRVIYNSVDVDALCGGADRETARDALGIASEHLVVLSVARLDVQKNQDTLLRAFRSVADRVPQARLVFAGTGPRRPALEALTQELAMSDRVAYLGVHRDVGMLYAAADVFALPSHFEGFPVALIEAMGCGLAVVASDIGPNREVVEDGTSGVLVHPDADDALADAIAALMSDGGRRHEIGRAARARIAARWSTSTIAAEWESLWAALLSSDRRHRR